MKTWITDERGNRNSVEYWGSEEAARKALESLKECSECSECSKAAPVENAVPAIPVIEDIHKKVYAAASQPGCFDMSSWYTCDTTHRRAGWVIHLAGEAGYALERRTDPVFAAMRIYEASGYEISPVRFFDDDDKALADMKKLAGLEEATV